MNHENPLLEDYGCLLTSGRTAAQLEIAVMARLAEAARTVYGSSEASAEALDVHLVSFYRWIQRDRRQNPQASDELRKSLERIAGALLDEQRLSPPPMEDATERTIYQRRADGDTPVQRISRSFRDGLAAAAIHRTQGRKDRAAAMLQVHRNWMTRHDSSRKPRVRKAAAA